MATWRTVINMVVSDMVTTIGTQTPAAEVAGGWPPMSKLQAVGAGQGSVVTVFDRAPAKDVTRFMPYTAVNVVVPTAGITATLAATQVNTGHTTTLTIAGTPNPANGDAVGLQISGAAILGGTAVVYVTQTGDTAALVAAGLAALINANIPTYMTASAASNVITLTNTAAVTENLAANVGAGATSLLEVRRVSRSLQIVVWANTPAERDSIADLIEARLALLQVSFGYSFADGTFGHVTFHSDINIDENVLANVYRRDFIIGLEYGITVADQVYTVLAGVDNITFEPATPLTS